MKRYTIYPFGGLMRRELPKALPTSQAKSEPAARFSRIDLMAHTARVAALLNPNK